MFTDSQIHDYMLECIEIAKQIQVPTHFSKKVSKIGAMVVSCNGNILGRGYKKILLGTRIFMHAERVALEEAGSDTKGAYIITTLEPCRQVKKSQIMRSCSQLIVESGIVGVVIGCLDQSPSMDMGQGAKYLADNRVEVKRYPALRSRILAELMDPRYNLQEENMLRKTLRTGNIGMLEDKAY